MHWRLSAAWGVAAAGCIGQPPLVDCEQDPAHELCESGSTAMMPTSSSTASTTMPTTTAPSSTVDPTDTDPSTTSEDLLPDPGVCRRDLEPLLAIDDPPLITVGNDQWEIAFDATDNGMPTELRATALNNANLLFTLDDPEERVIGVQLWPDHFSYVTGDGDAPMLFAIADGDAVGRVLVQWDSSVGGVGLTSANGADSDFLFTPDGRMIRSEFPFVTAGVGSDLWFSVVLALDAGRFTAVEWFSEQGGDGDYPLGEPPAAIFPGDPKQPNLDPVGFCAYNEDTGLAVAFGGDPARSGSDVCGVHPPIPEDARPWGFRASHATGNDGDTIALLFDFGRAYMPESTVYRSHTMAMVSVFPGDDPCACARAQLDAYMNPPMMHANPGSLTMQIPVTQEGEGDNDGYFEQGGYYAVIPTAETFSVTIDDRAVPSVLLRITDIGAVGDTDGVTARLGGIDLTPGVDFLAQPDADTNDGYWFWLGRELPPNTQLEISGDRLLE